MYPYLESYDHLVECQFISKYLLSDDLATFDPYDIWKTDIGICVKDLFNTSRLLGSLPALSLTLYDLLINNFLRLGYKKQEYPIVRALAAQISLNEYQRTNNQELLFAARKHLEWLILNKSVGYSGACWGLGFRWAAFKNVIYDANTPHATHTPYALEAFHHYTQITGDKRYVELIKSCFLFYENDLFVLYDDNEALAVSYGPAKDKIVTNVASYTLYAYTIFLNYLPDQKEFILNKIRKLYNFIYKNQQENGAWYYSHPENQSFIDCFHSCFIIKNLLKSDQTVPLKDIETVVEKGCRYIIEEFFSKKYGLYKRFTVNNKLSLIKFDLYDNAEVLNLLKMIGETERANNLEAAISKNFSKGTNIYSSIDFIGVRRNKNMLRWAALPYFYALTAIK